MTSGQYITWFVISFFPVFIAWELIQLARRRAGNKSAYTMSQYVIRQVKAGHRGWWWFVVLFPLFLALIGIWLSFHWWSWCYAFGWFCKIDI
jgi:hypothetical protein